MMETEALLVGADGAGTHAGGEIGVYDAVDVIDTLIERASRKKFKNGAEAKIFPVNFEFIIKAETKKPN